MIVIFFAINIASLCQYDSDHRSEKLTTEHKNLRKFCSRKNINLNKTVIHIKTCWQQNQISTSKTETKRRQVTVSQKQR